jgi:hypothetical protein
MLICPTGHANPIHQQYCGICGSGLSGPSVAPQPNVSYSSAPHDSAKPRWPVFVGVGGGLVIVCLVIVALTVLGHRPPTRTLNIDSSTTTKALTESENGYLSALHAAGQSHWQWDPDDSLVAQGHQICDELHDGQSIAESVLTGTWGPHPKEQAVAQEGAAIKWFCPDETTNFSRYLHGG